MEAAVGWATVTVSEVRGSSGVVGGKGGGGKGGGEVIAPLSWGLGCSGNGGGAEVAVRVEATLGWETERSSNNNNDDSSSSSNFQRLEQYQQKRQVLLLRDSSTLATAHTTAVTHLQYYHSRPGH